jgi:hypothetical protein
LRRARRRPGLPQNWHLCSNYMVADSPRNDLFECSGTDFLFSFQLNRHSERRGVNGRLHAPGVNNHSMPKTPNCPGQQASKTHQARLQTHRAYLLKRPEHSGRLAALSLGGTRVLLLVPAPRLTGKSRRHFSSSHSFLSAPTPSIVAHPQYPVQNEPPAA